MKFIFVIFLFLINSSILNASNNFISLTKDEEEFLKTINQLDFIMKKIGLLITLMNMIHLKVFQ